MLLKLLLQRRRYLTVKPIRSDTSRANELVVANELEQMSWLQQTSRLSQVGQMRQPKQVGQPKQLKQLKQVGQLGQVRTAPDLGKPFAPLLHLGQLVFHLFFSSNHLARGHGKVGFQLLQLLLQHLRHLTPCIMTRLRPNLLCHTQPH